jgi:hypothetical protein
MSVEEVTEEASRPWGSGRLPPVGLELAWTSASARTTSSGVRCRLRGRSPAGRPLSPQALRAVIVVVGIAAIVQLVT